MQDHQCPKTATKAELQKTPSKSSISNPCSLDVLCQEQIRQRLLIWKSQQFQVTFPTGKPQNAKRGRHDFALLASCVNQISFNSKPQDSARKRPIYFAVDQVLSSKRLSRYVSSAWTLYHSIKLDALFHTMIFGKIQYFTRRSFGVGVRWSRFLYQYDFVWSALDHSANYCGITLRETTKPSSVRVINKKISILLLWTGVYVPACTNK